MFEAVEGSVYIVLFFILYFEVFLLVAFLERMFEKPAAGSKRKILPSVSVIVPCFNEERTLARTVRSLLALDYPKNKLELLIVNDGSTDGTRSVADKFAKYNNVQVFHKENGGKHSALNLALEHAKGDLVSCLDADSYVEKDALRILVERFENEKVMAVTPAIKVFKPRGFLGHIQGAEYIIGIFFRHIFAFLGVQFITPGPFSTYRKKVFEQLGSFKNAYNTEDLEMGLRMQRNGFFIDNAPKAVVYTNVPTGFFALIKQRVRWAYGFLNNAVHYRDLFGNPKNLALGFIILPTVLASTLGGLLMVLFFFVNGFNTIFHKAVEFDAVKAVPIGLPEMSLFFTNTKPMLFIMLSLIAVTLVIFLIGTRVANEKVQGKGISLYLLFYGMLAPLWLSKAVFDAVVVRKNEWR